METFPCCSCKKQEYTLFSCYKCQGKYCIECNKDTHLKNNPNHINNLYIVCEECENDKCQIYCFQCGQVLCSVCDVSIHNKGTRAKHNRDQLTQKNQKNMEKIYNIKQNLNNGTDDQQYSSQISHDQNLKKENLEDAFNFLYFLQKEYRSEKIQNKDKHLEFTQNEVEQNKNINQNQYECQKNNFQNKIRMLQDLQKTDQEVNICSSSTSNSLSELKLIQIQNHGNDQNQRENIFHQNNQKKQYNVSKYLRQRSLSNSFNSNQCKYLQSKSYDLIKNYDYLENNLDLIQPKEFITSQPSNLKKKNQIHKLLQSNNNHNLNKEFQNENLIIQNSIQENNQNTEVEQIPQVQLKNKIRSELIMENVI